MGTVSRWCGSCEMEFCQSWMKTTNWRREKYTVKRTNEIHGHINKLSIRKLGNTIDEILWAFLIRSKTMRRLETILEQSLFLVDEARCSSALFLGHVVYLCLSSSSDDHRSWHSCLGTGTRVETQKLVLSLSVFVGPSGIIDRIVLCWRFGGSSITILPFLV